VLEARLYAKKQELIASSPKTTPKRKKDYEDYEDDEYEEEDDEDDEEEEEEEYDDEEYDESEDDDTDDSNPNERVFKASRLSKDNTVFPPTVIFNDQGVLVKIPALLRKKEGFIPYVAISGVRIETPLVGFSSIYFVGYGVTYNLKGFKKSEVKEMKRIIERGRL